MKNTAPDKRLEEKPLGEQDARRSEKLWWEPLKMYELPGTTRTFLAAAADLPVRASPSVTITIYSVWDVTKGRVDL